jgi:nucleotide-binding universal stress UspA family protein
MQITNILVPTDFSENAQTAFEVARDLARQLKAKLYLLHVRDASTLRTSIREGLLRADSTDEQLQEAVKRLTEERFSKMLAGLDQSEVEVEHCSRRGDSDAVIIDYAREVSADMIVIGRHGAGVVENIKSAILGSVAESLVRKSPCPVLVVRRDHRRGGVKG